MVNKLLIDLRGTPIEKDGIALPSGYGYFAYASCEDSFINELLKSMCIWSGSTGSYRTIYGDTFNKFELDCRDRIFLGSSTFKKICEKRKVDLIIATNENVTPIVEFFKTVKEFK